MALINNYYYDSYNKQYGDPYEIVKVKRFIQEIPYIPALCNNSTEIFEKLCGIKNIIRDINENIEIDSNKTLGELLKSGTNTFENIRLLNIMLGYAFDGLAIVLLKIVEDEETKNETKGN